MTTSMTSYTPLPSSESTANFRETQNNMSQGQPRRPEGQAQAQAQANQQEPIKYGDVFDVFNVSGELAAKPIAPQDAAMMQTAESMVFGETQKGGMAAVMQSAATQNERSATVGHTDMADVVGNQGVTVTETDLPAARIIIESVAGQVVGQYAQPRPVNTTQASGAVQQAAITIGEALEATAQTAGDKPVDQSDAAAIQAAEVRATGSKVITPGGLAATAQSAAAHNASMTSDDQKIKLNHILAGATGKLPADKAVTRQDAEGVVSAELRNSPNVATHPGGVAASMAAAARLNEGANA